MKNNYKKILENILNEKKHKVPDLKGGEILKVVKSDNFIVKLMKGKMTWTFTKGDTFKIINIDDWTTISWEVKPIKMKHIPSHDEEIGLGIPKNFLKKKIEQGIIQIKK